MSRTNRLTILLRLIYRFVPSWLFQYGSYYLYELRTQIANRPEFAHANQDLTCKIIRSNEEADELVATTGFDFRRRFANARKRLDKGAIAFCVLFRGQMANIGWVALSEEAKTTLYSLPQKVDFSKGEAYIGGLETIREYRRKDLASYGSVRRLQFLKERGITSMRGAVRVNNIAPQRVAPRHGAEIYARARYIRILWWRSWKETPVVQISHGD